MINCPVIRYHGAKFRLAPWIMSHFPPHRVYVEPFGGAAGVLMQKPRSESEVYNDLDGDIVNLFRVLRDPVAADRLTGLVTLTPYSRREFELAYEHADDPVERARRTLIRGTMGFGSAGATKHKTGFRADSAREYGTAAQVWAKYPEFIVSFCTRLSGVLIENRPALEILRAHDTPETLFYVDPPYVMSTRNIGHNSRYYNHEMTDQDHEELLRDLVSVRGGVVISNYDNELYADMLAAWERRQTEARISAGRGTGIRTECVWINPAAAEAAGQRCLFA